MLNIHWLQLTSAGWPSQSWPGVVLLPSLLDPTYPICNRQQRRGGEDLPDEVGAVAAESRLLEEPRYEFMVLHFVDVLLPQRTFTSEPVGDVLVGRLDQTHISHVPRRDGSVPDAHSSALLFALFSFLFVCAAQRRSSS